MDNQALSLSELETFIDRYAQPAPDVPHTACKQQHIPAMNDSDRCYVHVDTPTVLRGEKREASSPLIPLLSGSDNSSSISMITSTQNEKQTMISDYFVDKQPTRHQRQGHQPDQATTSTLMSSTCNTVISPTFAPTSSIHKTDTNQSAFQPSSTSTPMTLIFKPPHTQQQHSTLLHKPDTNTEMGDVDLRPHTSIPMVPSGLNPSHHTTEQEHGMNASLKSYLDNMTEIINTNIIESTRSLREIINGQTEELEHLRASNKTLVARTTIDEGRITRLEKNVSDLKENLLRLTQQTMKDNVILQGVPEVPSENVFHTVKTFMTDKLKISPDQMDEVYVNKAYRIGPKNDRYPRQIIAKVNDRGKSIIFQHTRNLKGTKYSVVHTDAPRTG
jgi:hypothetical protein